MESNLSSIGGGAAESHGGVAEPAPCHASAIRALPDKLVGLQRELRVELVQQSDFQQERRDGSNDRSDGCGVVAAGAMVLPGSRSAVAGGDDAGLHSLFPEPASITPVEIA